MGQGLEIPGLEHEFSMWVCNNPGYGTRNGSLTGLFTASKRVVPRLPPNDILQASCRRQLQSSSGGACGIHPFPRELLFGSTVHESFGQRSRLLVLFSGYFTTDQPPGPRRRTAWHSGFSSVVYFHFETAFNARARWDAKRAG